MMGKNWSKGTHPLDSEQRHISTPHQEDAQHDAASPVAEVIDSIKEAASGDEASRRFLLRVVQPGLAGLMDGSVSTLAPIFATAFATHRPFTAFLVGMAAATGAGISMAFSEALSDNGELTGRGSPVVRGAITGGMTFLGGSLHTLPFLVSNLHVALLIAYVVVAVELVAIAAIRYRFFGTKWWLSMLQVVGGGALVFAAALIFGNA
ncbi:MAG: VIT1/CCC1 transporter family protein [Ktedonobacteraceae bacterium]